MRGVTELTQNNHEPRKRRSTRRPVRDTEETPTVQQEPVHQTDEPDHAPASNIEGTETPQNDAETPEPSDDAGDKTSPAFKRPGADATGVDYSDKSMKDQLEHQAADAVMDATPGLSQFNSARKALKEHNKNKRDAGEPEGMSDKVEELMDKGVEKGIQGAKTSMAVKAGADAGKTGLVATAGVYIYNVIKMLLGTIFNFIMNTIALIGSIFSAVSGFLAQALGVALIVGQILTGTIGFTVIAVVTVFGYFSAQESMRDDSGPVCIPNTRTVSSESQQHLTEGEHDVIRREYATRLWSVFQTYGGTKEKTAAVLGNLHYESGGLDPTAVETILDEPYYLGPRKLNAIRLDFRVFDVDPEYASRHAIREYMGIGMAQWTDGRNRLLIDYADENNLNWYDFDTQVMFMFDGDYEYRQKELIEFLQAPPETVDVETTRFKEGWIGNLNDTEVKRQEHALDYYVMLEEIEADHVYAMSIVDGINGSRALGNHAAGAYHHDDGCGNPVISHYGNQAIDGTGEVPADLELKPWSRDTLPESLRSFAKNPEDAGLSWLSSAGWNDGGIPMIPDQCVAFSVSYFIALYPDWNNDGRPVIRTSGHGGWTAENWANHYGEPLSSAPSAGAVFSDRTTSEYGHTGVVQHVFANGDILIAEQNINGVSGRNFDPNGVAGLSYSWSWRVIKRDTYESKNWEFFKPSAYEPQWVSGL